MTDEKIFEMFQNFLDKLQKNTDELQEMLRNHEKRLIYLETKKDDGNIKSKLLEWMAKALIIAVTSICALAGGGSLLAKVIGL